MHVVKHTEKLLEYDPFLTPDWRAADGRRRANGEMARWSSEDPPIPEYAKFLKALAAADSVKKTGESAK